MESRQQCGGDGPHEQPPRPPPAHEKAAAATAAMEGSQRHTRKGEHDVEHLLLVLPRGNKGTARRDAKEAGSRESSQLKP